MKVPEIREKASQTCLKKYGKRNPSQVPEFFEKAENSFEKYDYELPSGKIIQLQGYEYLCMDVLLETYHEDDVIAGDRKLIPVITYDFKG